MARLTSIIDSSFTRCIGVIASVVLLVLVIAKTWVNEYAGPLAIPMELSANFGEIREGHWHMGLDIRTNGRENLPVYSVAEGYVSRLAISADGYGKVIYITHKNNRTSLYAHLNAFEPGLEKLISAKQSALESWEQDILLEPGRYTVNKGSLIGISGNTGHSEGPHLHFEWRNTKTGHCINPQLELFRQPDNIAPSLEAVYWYDQSAQGPSVNRQEISLRSGNRDIIVVGSPAIVLGITAVDKMQGSRFNMGVFTSRVLRDDSLIYKLDMDSIAIQSGRHSDYYIDYAAWYRDRQVIQMLRSPMLPGTKIDRGRQQSRAVAGESGSIDLRDQQVHRVRLELRDISGNLLVRNFLFRYDPGSRLRRNQVISIAQQPQKTEPEFTARQQNDFMIATTGIDRASDKYLLVEQSSLKEKNRRRNDAYFPVVNICEGQPLPVDSLTLKLRQLKPIDPVLSKKLVLLVRNNLRSAVYPGWLSDGWFCAKTTIPGEAAVICDTVSPTILLAGWKNKQLFRTGELLKILVKDNLNTISGFRAEIDGRWVAFDRKANQYTLLVDQQIHTGNRRLKIRVSDVAGNITTNIFHFQY